MSEIFSVYAKPGANAFIISRYLPEITDEFEKSEKLEIRAAEEDIQRYLTDHMFQSPFASCRSNLKAGITDDALI